MSRHPAGLAVASCILVFGISQVHAEDPPDDNIQFPEEKPRTPVAVIELGDFEPNRVLAQNLAVVLNDNRFLKPMDSSIKVDALRDTYTDEDSEPLGAAEELKRLAEEHVIAYKFSEADTAADTGLIRLHRAKPSPRVLSLSAELAFLLGAARLGERMNDKANLAFRFARSLDPTFKPNTARYLPEIVQAFEAAVKTAPLGKGWIGVNPTPGKAFLDGRDQGDLRTFADLTPGMHVVWMVGADRDTHAIRVDVVAGKLEPIVFEPEPIDEKKRIKRARLALRTAPDSTARAAAMQTLARLLEVKEAILLNESNGKTIVQTWRDQAPGFSALREVKPTEKPADLLEPLLPPKLIVPPRKPDPPKKLPIVVDPRSWYEKPRYQIAGGTVGVVVIGIAIYALASWSRSFFTTGKAGFEQ